MSNSCASAFGSNRVVVGDPVDVVTGAWLEFQTDFVLAGPLPLIWARYADSTRNWNPGTLGWGRTHYYDRRLQATVDGFRYHGPEGLVVEFPHVEKAFQRIACAGLTLVRLPEALWSIRERGKPDVVFRLNAESRYGLPIALEQGTDRVEFRYDSANLLTGILDSLGRVLTVEHDASARLKRIIKTGTNGKPETVVEYFYDADGNLVRVVDPYRNATTYRADAEHRVVQAVDRRGYRFDYAYDAEGRCIRAGGHDRADLLTFDYDSASKATLVTNAEGGRRLYLYDDNKHVINIIEPDGGVRTFVPDADGHVTRELDPLGLSTLNVFGTDGAKVGAIDPEGWYRIAGEEPQDPTDHEIAAAPVAYLHGNLFLGQLPPGDVGTELADDYGTPYRIDYPDGTHERFGHDPNGNCIKIVDRRGGVTVREIASWNELRAEIDPAGLRTEYRYTTTGKAASVVDPGGTKTSYRWDENDRLCEVIHSGETNERYRYDLGGRLIEKTDKQGRTLVEFDYAAGTRPIACRYADGVTETFAYDAAGRTIAMTNAHGTTALAYENGKRILDQRDGQGVAHTFGTDGLAESLVHGLFRIRYDWTDADTLTITDPAGAVHTLTSTASGVRERSYESVVREVARFGGDGECLGKSVIGPSAANAVTYRYGTAGELLQRGTTTFDYDASLRLVTAIEPRGRSEFRYDAAGNLTAMPGLEASIGGGNHLAAVNDDRCEYDDRDHLAARTGPNGTTRYHYDDADRLVRIETPGQPDWTATYDPFHRRVSKSWGNGRRTEFWWDTDRILAERDETDRLRVYVYADDLALIPVGFVDYPAGVHDPEQGRSYIVHGDQLGTPTAVYDRTGKLVWQAEIAPYGAAAVSVAEVPFHFAFPGHYRDDETGLHDNRFRSYSPKLGRYLQTDPLGVEGGVNLYAYPARPLDLVDLQGLKKPAGRVGSQPKRTKGAGKNCPRCAAAAAKSKANGVVRNANNGVNFAKSQSLYPAKPGEKNTVKIKYTGSRRQDFGEANKKANTGNTQKPPVGYTWHHLDDYNPKTNTGTMQLVKTSAHEATYPHAGGVSQYEKANGVEYK